MRHADSDFTRPREVRLSRVSYLWELKDISAFAFVKLDMTRTNFS